ncbi:MAG: DMT family transporter [Burkholderiales bacterium]|nr:DMT family transporter [Burkholderiales bacterium]
MSSPPRVRTAPPQSVTGAAGWMLGAVAALTAMAIAGRELASELSTFQILFFRSLIGLGVICVLVQRAGWVSVKTHRLGAHAARNAAHFAGQFGWFFGIALIPLTEVFAIEFTTPLWTALFAVLLLRERLTWLRVAGILFGFVGTLVILRPGMDAVSPGALAVLGAAFAYAFAHTMTKRLSSTESPLSILFYMSALQLPLGLLPALAKGWVWPSVQAWPWVLVVSLCGLAGHYCLARAFRLADASVVVPIDFVRLPLIAVIGYLLYREPLDPYVMLGAAVVVAGTWLTLRSARI